VKKTFENKNLVQACMGLYDSHLEVFFQKYFNRKLSDVLLAL